VGSGLPTAGDLEACAALEGIDLERGEASELLPVVTALVGTAGIVDELEAPLPAPRHGPRDPGHRPSAGEDPFNAFITKCRVEGAAGGPLAGRSIGVKDNISVAGVPTTNGSLLPAYTPSVDAVVVERILDAGGTITGKLNMDAFGAAGTGETSAFGPARNPVDSAYSAGGSSGGSGAAVRAGDVDLALAVDQGGSGRIPAAFCGVVGVKGTHGLVPSFGITYIDHTIDSIAPIARTVRDAALLLEVIAGPDPRDPQWVRAAVETASYTGAEAEGVVDLSVAIVEESCNAEICDEAVLEGVERAAAALEGAGARVTRISLPIWAKALAIFQPYIACLISNMVRSEGAAYGHLGAVDPEVVEAFGRGRREHSGDLPKQLKSWLIAERWLHERDGNATYARLHNLRLLVRERVSAALGEHDVLLTPTLPMTAPRLPEGTASFAEISSRTSAALCFNTAPLNLTGHPAITVPSGADASGLPTAVQLVSSHFDDVTGFRAAFELERALGPFVPA
jgi:amidase